MARVAISDVRVAPDLQTTERSNWIESRGLVAEDTTFLRGLLGGIRCGVLAVDRHGDLLLINRHGCDILGFDDPPAAGQCASAAFEEHPHLVRMLGEAFTVTELPNRAELDLGPALREGTRIGFTVSHIPGIDGESVGAAVFFKDLTRIEHREEKERLRDRLAALGEMAARLAHEVRNPLASIEVTCGLLRRRFADDESARELIDKIRAEVQRLNGTVTSSLEFVKPASSNFGSAELQPLIDEAMTVARDRHDRPEVEIRIGKRVDLPVLRADRDQLRQVFENLVLNAAEAVGDSGQVVIDVERVAAPKTVSASYDEPLRSDDLVTSEFDEFIVVRVSDDGPGIPEQARGRIFHPFFTTKRQGSGVGLSTVKKIVDSHGGLIDVDRSTLGGARFTVRLPLISATLESLEGQQR